MALNARVTSLLPVVFYAAGTVIFDSVGPADSLGAVFIAPLFERILKFVEEVSVEVTRLGSNARQ